MLTTNTNTIKRMRKRSGLDEDSKICPSTKRRKLSSDDKEKPSTSSNLKQEQTVNKDLYPDHQQWPMMDIASSYWSVHKIKIVEDKIGIIKYRESGNHHFEVTVFTNSKEKNLKINSYITSLDQIIFDEKLNSVIIAYDTSFIELYKYNKGTFKKQIFGVHKYDKDLISIVLNKTSLILFTKRGRMYHANINESAFDDPSSISHRSTRYLPCMYRLSRFSVSFVVIIFCTKNGKNEFCE